MYSYYWWLYTSTVVQPNLRGDSYFSYLYVSERDRTFILIQDHKDISTGNKLQKTKSVHRQLLVNV